MKRKPVVTGIWLVVLSVVAALLLSSGNTIILLGWIPLVAPIIVIVEAIGITMIFTARVSGWAKRLAVIGAALTTLAFAISTMVEVQPTEQILIGGGGSILAITLLFMAVGSAIDRWKHDGFTAVRFRMIGLLVGSVVLGYFILPYYSHGFIDILNVLPLALFFGGFSGFFLGWLIDHIVLSGRKLFNSFAWCELVAWFGLGVILQIITILILWIFHPLSTPAQQETWGVVIYFVPWMILGGLFLFYYMYYFPWKLKSPWNWIIILWFGGIILGLAFLVIGDAVRRIAGLLYTGTKPVSFAFGGLTQPGLIRARKPFNLTLVIGTIVLFVILGIFLLIIKG